MRLSGKVVSVTPLTDGSDWSTVVIGTQKALCLSTSARALECAKKLDVEVVIVANDNSFQLISWWPKEFGVMAKIQEMYMDRKKSVRRIAAGKKVKQ